MFISIIRVRGLGYPERLISFLGAGGCGVVGVGMFVVVVVSVSVVVVVVVSVSAPLGGSPRGVARPTRRPASRPAGWPAALSALSALFVKSRIRRKKSDPPPFL